MEFEKQFPSLSKIVADHPEGYSSEETEGCYLIEDIKKLCLDKELVKRAIAKSCVVVHFDGIPIIKDGYERHLGTDIFEEIWKELGL